jgi:hypothetical protein
MSNTESQAVDRTELRRSVRRTIKQADDAPHRSDVVGIVAAGMGVAETVVNDELDALEQHGFVYLVGDGDPEVKLP